MKYLVLSDMHADFNFKLYNKKHQNDWSDEQANDTFTKWWNMKQLPQTEGIVIAGDISNARDLFTRAIAYLENMDKTKEAEAEGVNLYVTTLSNLCNCCNRQKEYHAVVNFASKGLKIKELPKLYYFRAIANANNDEFASAKEDLESLKKLLPEKDRDSDEGVKFVVNLIEQKEKAISSRVKKNAIYAKKT